ncbi:hypothetical protein ACLE20_13160 [Rhizobium sp. YIM 134829]|uniref:hypothetical protein n=1 Tax=Rhizobium sp. YIM 134829 TaxID=3390453 RepID=UPI00397C59C3
MNPAGLMLIGAAVGIVGIIASALSQTDVSVMLFAAGALFGKGYGIWEVKR